MLHEFQSYLYALYSRSFLHTRICKIGPISISLNFGAVDNKRFCTLKIVTFLIYSFLRASYPCETHINVHLFLIFSVRAKQLRTHGEDFHEIC